MNRVLLPVLALLVAGCDSHYGVVRKAQLNDFVDHKCIEQSLQSIQEISNIKYTFMGGSPEMTKSMKDVYALHRYHYIVGDINSFITILTNEDGAEIGLFTTRNMLPPSQGDISKIRPIMDKVQIAISHHCNIGEFQSYIVERCTKVQCT